MTPGGSLGFFRVQGLLAGFRGLVFTGLGKGRSEG